MTTNRNFKVNPKNGWKYATVDEMQKESANMIGEYNCVNPQVIYTKFCEIDVYLPSVAYLFTGKNGDVLLDFLLIAKPAKIMKLIGSEYDKLSVKIEETKQI